MSRIEPAGFQEARAAAARRGFRLVFATCDAHRERFGGHTMALIRGGTLDSVEARFDSVFQANEWLSLFDAVRPQEARRAPQGRQAMSGPAGA